MDHPNLTHWDDVEAEEGAAGEIRARGCFWQDGRTYAVAADGEE